MKNYMKPEVEVIDFAAEAIMLEFDEDDMNGETVSADVVDPG